MYEEELYSWEFVLMAHLLIAYGAPKWGPDAKTTRQKQKDENNMVGMIFLKFVVQTKCTMIMIAYLMPACIGTQTLSLPRVVFGTPPLTSPQMPLSALCFVFSLNTP